MLHLKVRNGADVVDEVLRGGVLDARFAEALLDEVPGVTYVLNLVLKVLSEPLAGGILAGAIVERADEVEDDIQRVGH